MIKIDVYIDAETVPPILNAKQLEDFKNNLKVPGNIKKEATIIQWREDNWLEKYKKMATDTNRANILTLGFSLNKKQPIVFINDEFDHNDLLNSFYEKIKEEAIIKGKEQDIEITKEDLEGDDFMSFININWYGFNIRHFDLDLLWKHAIKCRNKKVAKLIPRKRYDNSVKDIMEIFTTKSNEYISQEEVCDILGLKGKPNDIDGSKVYDYYIAGKVDEIAAYNHFDIEKVIELSEILDI